jgi:hypothetical protein
VNRSQAKYVMRQPRRSRVVGNVDPKLDSNPWESWYYVEPGGIDIMVRKGGVGTVAVKLSKRQLEQALRLIQQSNG